MLQPVALEEQARELLKAGDFAQALQLADVAAGEGAPWVEDAYAEAAFLLIHGRLLSQHALFLLSSTKHALDELDGTQGMPAWRRSGKGHPCLMQVLGSKQGACASNLVCLRRAALQGSSGCAAPLQHQHCAAGGAVPAVP